MSIFKNRTVIGIICILLALVICFGITPLFRLVNSSPKTWSPRPRSAPTTSPPVL